MEGAVRLSNDWCWPYSQSMLPQSSTAACNTSLSIFSGPDAELAGSTAAVAEGPVSICVNIGAGSDYVGSGAVMTLFAKGPSLSSIATSSMKMLTRHSCRRNVAVLIVISWVSQMAMAAT